MKTYEQKIGDEIIRYYYDPHIRFWTLYRIDEGGNQISDAEYYGNKEQLKCNYKELNFKTK